MKLKIYLSLLTVVLMTLMGCGLIKDDQAGVTITGNTGKIYGYVALPEKTLARKTVSTIVAEDSTLTLWKSIRVILAQAVDTGWVLDSSKVDSAGFFTFNSLVAGRYFVAAHFPDGSTLQHDAIQLEEGQSLEVTLEGKPILAIEGFQTWNLNIKCENGPEDTAKRAALFGPSHPSPLVSVRFLEASYQNIGYMYSFYQIFGTKISVQFPKSQTSKPDTVEIIVDAGIYNGSDITQFPRSKVKDTLIPPQDTTPNRRLRITWDSNGPSCILLDSIGIPHVSCESYTPPQVAGDIEIQSEIGSILKDFASSQINDSIKGVLFQDFVTRGGGPGGANDLFISKAIADTSSDTSLNLQIFPDVDRQVIANIPQSIFDGLKADSTLHTIHIGQTRNTTDYWGAVPAAFVNATSQPYQDLWVPFESKGNYNYNNWLQQWYPRYQVQGSVNLRKSGEYALLEFYGGNCRRGNEYLLKQDDQMVYRIILHWVTPAMCID